MSLATICHTVVNFLCYKVWTGLVVPYLCTWGLDLSVIQVATPSKSSLVIGSFLAAALTFVAIVALIAEVGHLAVPMNTCCAQHIYDVNVLFASCGHWRLAGLGS